MLGWPNGTFERVWLMLSSLVRETFMNQRELSCTARLSPEMEEGACPDAGTSIRVLLGSTKI